MTNHLLSVIQDPNLSQQAAKAGILTAAAIITSFVAYSIWPSKAYNSCPIVPYSNPIFGSTIEYYKNPKGFIEKWTEKLGPVYRVHLFGWVHTIVSGVYVHEVFNNKNFDMRTGVMKKFNLRLLAGLNLDEAGENVVVKVIAKYITQHLGDFAPRIAKNLYISFNEVLGDVKAGDSVEIADIHRLLHRTVARSNASVIVGEDLCQNSEMVDIFQNLTKEIISLHPRYSPIREALFPWIQQLQTWAIGKLSKLPNRYRRRLYEILKPEIDMRLKRMQDPIWPRPLDALQGLIELNGPSKQDLYETIVSQLMVIIFASINTTAQEGTTAIYRLAENSDLRDELLQEQEEILQQYTVNPSGSNEEIFKADVINKMVKLESFHRESLRFIYKFYDTPHTHIGKDSIVLSNGTVIEPGTDILINVYYNHRSDSWSGITIQEERSKFKPFRFLESKKRGSAVGDDDYIVFGQGRHVCPGRHLAIYQLKVMMSTLIRDYDISASGDIVYPTVMGKRLPTGPITITRRQNSV